MRLLSLIAAMTMALLPAFAAAQVYPTNSPVYIPTPALTSSLSAAGTVSMVTQGLGTVTARISGTNTGVAGTFQGTNEFGSSPTWTTIPVTQIGGVGGSLSNITGNGFYRLNATGFAKVRFNMTAISTGSVAVAMAGSPASAIVTASPLRRATYSASITGLTPAASATDFFSLTGSASVTVRVNRVTCSGISTAAATKSIEAVKRTTANTGGTSSAPTSAKHDVNDPTASATILAYTANPTTGTSSAPTIVKHDVNDPTASATILAYTANPTTGTSAGAIRTGFLSTNTAATSAFASAPLDWTFNSEGMEPFTLRGITEVFSLNGVGASFTAGSALSCTVSWTEE